MNPTWTDALSSLQIVFDPVHGPIGPHVGPSYDGTVANLLGSPMLDRLRRIKQLGFASYGYLAADHSRYAHAVGTMHVMRSILQRLRDIPGFFDGVVRDLKACSPHFTIGKQKDLSEAFFQHMLVAALLQDVGELPYSVATRHIFRASAKARHDAADVAGGSVAELAHWGEEKNIFTVASFAIEENRELLAGLDMKFLVYLITGWSRATFEKNSTIPALRHILNGAVDADRLDYVFRDAYHTIGGIGTPLAVIQSIVGYDVNGPIFSDSTPVCNFLLTRASLWTSVYFAPQTRFRTVLLNLVLSAVHRDDRARKLLFPNETDGKLHPDQFTLLDDLYINTGLEHLAHAKGKHQPNFSPRVERALQILRGKDSGYHCLWISKKDSVVPTPPHFELPNDLYFDLYEDYNQHSLYRAGSVRIDAARFANIGRPIPLEQASGPFRPLFTSAWSALPMPGSVLLFWPNEPEGERWSDVNVAIEEGWLHPALTEVSVLSDLRCPPETWSNAALKGPRIFVSYTSADRRVVRAVLESLARLQRKYFAYFGKTMGVGGSPINNSRDAAAVCDAAILLVSKAYIDKYDDKAHGGLAAEFDELASQYDKKRIPVVPLALDPREQLQNFRHERFGHDDQYFLGAEPLGAVSDEEIDEAIGDALKRIDGRLPPRKSRK
jgi:HD superfamily phosphohydrolase